MSTPQKLQTDANRQVIDFADGVVVKKTITFDGGTENGIGDHDGTGDPFTIFNVTGAVLVKVFGVCTTDLAGATATVEVGVSGSTASLIAQTTATDIDENDIWHDATPDAPIEAYSVATQNIIGNSQDIIGTVATANITAGVIDFYCIYQPLSDGAKIEAA